MYPGLAPILVGEYGPDIVIPAGGGMLGHPDGYTAGTKWLRVAPQFHPHKMKFDA